MSNPNSARHKPLPQCKAFLLCEKVDYDEETGQVSLHKLIEVFRYPIFPAESIRFVIFMQLYDGVGRYELAIEIRDWARNSSMSVASFDGLEFPERLAKMDVVLPIEFLRLPSEGRYEFAVLLNGEELATQPIFAELHDDKQSE